MRHAHPHCHVLLKVEGDNTQFLVGEHIAPLTDELAVLVNAWEPHASVHDPRRGHTIILALYIEPQWLAEFRPNWEASSGASVPIIARWTRNWCVRPVSGMSATQAARLPAVSRVA